jgi:tRNA 2-thiouridine synthesizing protein A
MLMQHNHDIAHRYRPGDAREAIGPGVPAQVFSATDAWGQAVNLISFRIHSTKWRLHMNISKELDARGLNCPLPILRTKQAIAGLTAGEVLKVMATDPGSLKDMDAFCRQTGNQLLQSGQEGDAFLFLIQKA